MGEREVKKYVEGEKKRERDGREVRVDKATILGVVGRESAYLQRR